MSDMLSKNFSLKEFIRSEKAESLGINNYPGVDELKNLYTIVPKMEFIREYLGGNPISISSGFRSVELNKAIGGSSNSAHCKGLAVDFVAPYFGNPFDVCKKIIESGIEFDQLINEKTWIHIGFSEPMRNQTLTANFSGNKVTYSVGI